MRYAKSLKLAATHNWSADEYRLKEVDNAESSQNKKEMTKGIRAEKIIKSQLQEGKMTYSKLVNYVATLDDGDNAPIGEPTAKSVINKMIKEKLLVSDKDNNYTLARLDSK